MSIGLEGFKVKCRTCRAVLYETTKDYTCHKPLTGNMLRLLPLYKDWPTYDGSLAVESTSRFLMFCSACSGYITTTGKLDFADFPDEKVHVISGERAKLIWREAGEPVKKAQALHSEPLPKAKPPIKAEIFIPKDIMKKLEKEATSFNKKRGE